MTWLTPLYICIGIIGLLLIGDAVLFFLWQKARTQTADAEKQMRKLKYDLSIKSIGMLEKIETLSEEKSALEEALEAVKNEKITASG